MGHNWGAGQFAPTNFLYRKVKNWDSAICSIYHYFCEKLEK